LTLLLALASGPLAPEASAQPAPAGRGPFAVTAAVDSAAQAPAAQPAPAGAAGPAAPAPVRTLTLDDALAIALQDNPVVKKAVEYKAWVQGKYLEERAYALPHVSFGANWRRQFDDSQSKLFQNLGDFGGGDTGGDAGGSSFDFGEIFGGRHDVGTAEVRVNQVVFTWGQVGAAIRAARVGFTFADDQLRQAQQTVIRDVATAFYDVLIAQEALAITTEDLAQKERVLARPRTTTCCRPKSWRRTRGRLSSAPRTPSGRRRTVSASCCRTRRTTWT